ncbi:phosphomethylpyrimidine synthase ThiC [Rhizobium esperanzae]|uniref:Phosphomethylpyrimidine synthase ThiC n=1 Tax=Rhizobium esperanzae TaxID=1967781 RepID=A0A2D0AAG4_9HYPH|nr:phosphomethylpyrimidine synthase ThiC [Rhizobium esperanzae]
MPMRGISVHPTAGEPPFVVYDSSHPDTARSYRDETLPKEAHRVAHFCSMRISHNIRAEAQKEGLDAMAAKYRQGGDLYMSVVEAAKIPIGG